MRQAAVLLLLAALAPAVTGCASMRTFHERVEAKKRALRGEAAPATAPRVTGVTTADGQIVAMTDLKALPAPDGSAPRPATPQTPVASAPVAAAAPAAPGSLPPGMQFLYGSGEAAALDYQAYLGLIDTIIAKSSDRAVGHKIASVVLAPGAMLAAPKFAPCGDKPLAAVFDIDETALLNLGYEADDSQRRAPYDQARWERWEKTGGNAVAATPGMAEVVRVAKASGVALVFNSNRSAANADATAAALAGAGLGTVTHGDTLWLQGDAGAGSGKDARRAAIAAKYCVVAMAGDQLGDFSDLFNASGLTPAARRALAGGTEIKLLWGHGWFVLPNPVYGTALKGGIDEVFPADKRWSDPGGSPPAGTPAP